MSTSVMKAWQRINIVQSSADMGERIVRHFRGALHVALGLSFRIRTRTVVAAGY